MKDTKLLYALLLLTFGLFTLSGCGADPKPNITIENPYTRTTPPSAPVAGGFMKVTNNSSEADTLIGGQADFAEFVEVHEMPMVDGVMKMRQLKNGLEIPAGESVELKPGGYHIMFIKLSEQMKEGDKHEVTLNFAKAGAMTVEFVVKDIAAAMSDSKK